MRAVLRNVVVAALALGLVAVFLRNADLAKVWSAMRAARPDLLLLAVALTVLTQVVRTERWQYLLAPLGPTRFRVAFRTTVMGFAASAVLPARAGEVLRPYLLARRENLSFTATFATVIVERVVDLAVVLLLLGAYLVWFDTGMDGRDSSLFAAIRLGGLVMAPVALVALIAMFVMAGHPEALHRLMLRAERVLPTRLAAAIARAVQMLAEGFAVVRRPERWIGTLGWSVVLWVLIAAETWIVALAFNIAMPFTGAWLLQVMLVVGVAVPTPGGVGGFHEAFRLGATSFFGADNDAAVAAAIVLHAASFVPITVMGFWFAAQDGGLRSLAAGSRSVKT